eukprot:TRINITY_DN68099_c2_g11_i1.p2 TRINITY_DN68099_c2_g11~~TRINITY_DN68099_c2_g11_i1.p2  ORF type:complete len:152 (-),score=8.53 TRINITY_DN68099_c2_g11_i1:90-545(-)
MQAGTFHVQGGKSLHVSGGSTCSEGGGFSFNVKSQINPGDLMEVSNLVASEGCAVNCGAATSCTVQDSHFSAGASITVSGVKNLVKGVDLSAGSIYCSPPSPSTGSCSLQDVTAKEMYLQTGAVALVHNVTFAPSATMNFTHGAQFCTGTA